MLSESLGSGKRKDGEKQTITQIYAHFPNIQNPHDDESQDVALAKAHRHWKLS